MTPFNRLLAIMLKPWVLILSIVFLVISYNYIDMPLAAYLHAADLQTTLPILPWLTKLGLGGIYLLGFLAAALFFRYVRKNSVWEARFWFLWCSVVTTSVICVVLKIMLGRARPDMWFQKHDYGFYWFQTKAAYWSFPSGHTSTVMGAAFGLCILFPRHGKAFIAVGLLIALSRVLLTNHYLSDVVSAAILALLEVGLLFGILQKNSWLKSAWQNNRYQPGSQESYDVI